MKRADRYLDSFLRRHRVLAIFALVVLALTIGVVAFASAKRERATFSISLPVPSVGEGFDAALYQGTGARLMAGHEVRWLNDGAVFDAVAEDIRRARSSVHVVMYIWEKGEASDRVTSALVERARAGVACRVLVDAFGSPDFDRDVKPALAAAGCNVRTFRPLPGTDDLARNHRKIVVVDGNVAITGGFGVRDDWLGDGVHDERWRDANVRFTGPALEGAQQAFAENWQEAGGDLLPGSAFPPPDANGPAAAAFIGSTGSPVVTKAERVTQLMIGAARKRIWIANAYFVPSRAILELLGRRASEGIDVRILAPGKKSDSKTAFGVQHVHYHDLVKRGVRVWEYLPSMMHAKTMLVDDDLVLVGSINLDPLSLDVLDDAALVVRERAFATELERTFAVDCGRAKELSAR